MLHVKTSLKLLLSLVSLGLLISCATPDWNPSPLSDKILKPRVGYKGLTNRYCVKWNALEQCDEWKVEDYDLNDKEVRERLRSSGITCKVSEKRYKICKDEPGLCRRAGTEKCFLFFCNTEYKEEVIPISNYQFLLDITAKCFNEDRYPFLDVK